MIRKRVKRKQTNKVLKYVFFSFIFMLAIGLWMGNKYYRYTFAPNIVLQPNTEPFLYIPTNANIDDVILLANSKKLLKNEKSFLWVAEQKQYTSNIKPGRYKITHKMSNNELVNLLRSGKQTPLKVTFNNIRTKEELAGKIASKLELDSTSLIKLLNNKGYLTKINFTPETVISAFIPNTYEFYWNTNANNFVARMLKEYHKFWDNEKLKKAEELNLSPSQISTLASIVDEETSKNDEKPIVAGLYLNRIKKGIRLQADPTVKFAIGDFTIQRIWKKDLEIDSPYNTYKYAGLPPGPIRMPSISGLKSVLNHQKHNYIYMCAKEDFSGYHNFAKTLAQHNQNATKYQKALRKRGIRR